MSPFTFPGLGPLPWIDVVLLGWLALTAVSVIYVAWDNFANKNRMKDMFAQGGPGSYRTALRRSFMPSGSR